MNMKILVLISLVTHIKCAWHFDAPPIAAVSPCPANDNITAIYISDKAPEDENKYDVKFKSKLPNYSQVYIQFDSEASIKLEPPSSKAARVTTSGKSFQITFFKNADSLDFQVSGPHIGVIPYITGFYVNGDEYCSNALVGYFDNLVKGYMDSASTKIEEPDEFCGRRKIKHTELIVNGVDTKPGDWPWHAAIFRFEKRIFTYICGGTLLSKSWVLTAAHCVTIRGIPVLPEILNVILGKYNLIGGDVATQEKEVYQILVHEDFTYRSLASDLALLKLKVEATFDDYVQPACVWHEKISERISSDVTGSVVGWGIDESENLSTKLRQATMPIVSEAKCIKRNPLFYSKVLDDRKFCAGLQNGTSACNGDSGGGFHVFIPDKDDEATGAWYIRGIVSLSAARREVALCDPHQYVVFTDISKYEQWVNKYVTSK
ncbi:PREDICTED: chymotrypsin-like elastase family member 2A [Papilio polytes]|uniref:chymotrypsin-like elastase family member 2A n=1 Tax=Papilio polytes TaxID=76194 RepID=UPI0006767A03|nr:PREDICTED: chymotrypsin-like elastase family member 2A [Papilio polytes]